MHPFKFNLGQQVTLKYSNETGEIIAIAQYLSDPEIRYLIRYKAGNGCLVEAWWGETAIVQE